MVTSINSILVLVLIQKDHTELLKMLASRATNFPFFPIGGHISEVFIALDMPIQKHEKMVEADAKAIQDSLLYKFR